MSLSSVVDISRSALSVTSELTGIASRNIANASNSGATRKTADLVTMFGGAPRVASIGRSTSGALQDGVIEATSDAARLDVVVAALDKLDLTAGDSQSSASAASKLGVLKAALQTYSANPADRTSAAGVLSSAGEVVSAMHDWAGGADDVRLQANADISASVSNLNTYLKQVGELNAQIVNGTIAGADVTDQLDARDQAIAGISREVGVTVVNRNSNSIALYTDSGMTLFDGEARPVSMQSAPLVDGAAGPAVLIDGVPATGAGAVMPVSSGRIAGLVEVRDKLATTFSAQLDALAGGLIRAFAESDQRTPSTLPMAAGLFVSSTSTVVPAAGSAVAGLAKSIAINATADPSQGGDLLRLRDGGISNPGNGAYLYNSTGASGYTGRIQQLADALSQTQTFTAASGISPSASLSEFAAASMGWLQGQMQTSSQESSAASAFLQRAQDTLNKTSGINIDDEMTQLLDLERTYQASAKLISTVDSMFNTLIQAV